MRLESQAGTVEIALTDQDHLRLRGKGVGLRLVLRPAAERDGTGACGGLCRFGQGDWEGEFGKYGKLRFRAIQGDIVPDTPWDTAHGRFLRVYIDFIPTAGGVFEAAIHEDMTEFAGFPEAYPDFSEAVLANRQSFDEWKKKYRPAAKEYEDIAEYAKWTTWSLMSKATGGIKEPVIFMHLHWAIGAFSWQQSYNAMALLNDPREAWRLICSLFEYQDDTGRLPFIINYKGGALGGMQPPFQGLAFDFLIRNHGESFLTYEDCERMYPKFKKWVEFWLTQRNAGRGDDVTAILSSHEAGWDDASIFKDGFPARNPDIMSFIILCMEAVSCLARGCGRLAEAEDWKDRSARLLKTLIDEHWDGGKFVTYVGDKAVQSQSLVCYEPIMLGNRLPQHIIDKVAERLTEEGDFLSPIGLCGESLKSPLCDFGNRFILGRVVAPLQMICTVGLMNAGKKKEAALIARRFCDKVREKGVILGFAPFDYYPLTGEKATDVYDFEEKPVASDGWPWSGWSACNVMTMLTAVIPADSEA
jgi:hypothetical protein